MALALRLIATADESLLEITALSLRVSGAATLLATVLGVALGAGLAVAGFVGKRAVVGLLNTLLALPPVVVGLSVYLLLSRSGPLGEWGLLFTPGAMVIAQTVLVLPLVAALTHQLVADAVRAHGEQLHAMGASAVQTLALLLLHQRHALVIVLLSAFGRAISEVGAVMIVGGNIDGVTRVMTTAIALETSKGDLPLALGMGVVLLLIVAMLNLGVALLRSAGTSNVAVRS